MTGATGYVGGRLIEQLGDEHDVRPMSRKGDGAVNADVVSGEGLDEALEGVDVAYYLVHAMGQKGDFAARDRQGAENFGKAAAKAGVGRVVYLGGLEGAASEHLRSREEVAEILAGHVPTVHARAAMVIGDRQLLVHHAPQADRAAAGDDHPALARHEDPADRDRATSRRRSPRSRTHDDPPDEVQLGGADVLTYRDMVQRTREGARAAQAADRSRCPS